MCRATSYDYQNLTKEGIGNTMKKVRQLSRGPSRGSGSGVQFNVGVGISSFSEDRDTIRQVRL